MESFSETNLEASPRLRLATEQLGAIISRTDEVLQDQPEAAPQLSPIPETAEEWEKFTAMEVDQSGVIPPSNTMEIEKIEVLKDNEIEAAKSPITDSEVVNAALSMAKKTVDVAAESFIQTGKDKATQAEVAAEEQAADKSDEDSDSSSSSDDDNHSLPQGTRKVSSSHTSNLSKPHSSSPQPFVKDNVDSKAEDPNVTKAEASMA